MNNISSLTDITNKLTTLAEKYNSSLSYSNHEIEGIGHKILKHYYIYSLNFEDLNEKEYRKLLKEIKQINNIKIENIHNDKINYN